MSQSELLSLIDRLVEQKTFSLDAVSTVKDLRDKVQGLETKLESANIAAKNYRETSDRVTAESLAKTEEIKAWKARETALVDREKRMTGMEQNAAVAQAQSAVWSDAFHTIFANRVTREHISSSVPYSYVMPGNSYPTTGVNQHSEERSREER